MIDLNTVGIKIKHSMQSVIKAFEHGLFCKFPILKSCIINLPPNYKYKNNSNVSKDFKSLLYCNSLDIFNSEKLHFFPLT